MNTVESGEARDYSARLRNRLAEVVRSPGSHSFWDIVRNCEGAFPTDVRDAIQATGDPRLVGWDFEDAAGSGCAHAPECKDSLPEPHPVDFDWRFAKESRQLLLDLIQSRTSAISRVLLLCTPTLLADVGQHHRTATLVDHNQASVQALQRSGHVGAICADVFDPELPVAKESFDLCVIDPPWYPEYYRSCLRHAAIALHEGGVAWISLLPQLTRPTAIADRRAVIQEAISLGFDLIQLDRNRLTYKVPRFECETLRACGLPCEPWRCGDLLGLRKVASVSIERVFDPPSEKWESFILGTVQVKIRGRVGCLHGFSADPVGDSKTLDSVSRRYARRDEIDAWNSRNVAFSISNVGPLRTALSLIQINDVSLREAAYEAARIHSLTGHEAQTLEEVVRHLAAL